ncbi:MAG: NUDIX hydrolase [Anaerolineales bacterium]
MAKKKQEVIHAAGGIIWKEVGKEKKLAVVHRHKHNDWSLPKGKLNSGESWKKAALREVLEETGCIGKIKKYAGSISYLLDGRPKVVLFWHMDIKSLAPEKTNGEVDEIRWLSIEEAMEILDHEDEKELLLSSPYKRIKGT